jgi:PPK2 family polyphosphate:nucleotide phosphotransferase
MLKLSDYSTKAPKGVDEDDIRKETKSIAKRIAELHEVLVAEKKNNLLVVLQGMDTSGKDGTARNAFKYCSPVGLGAYSFKKPTDEEFAHDFLWRVHKQTPAKGEIKVFVRSHYEDVLIQRVHKWIDEKTVTARINAINSFEENLLKDNNTTILKFYMHLSKDRQLEKLQERIDDPDKNWKHNPSDWDERNHWDAYMHAYEDVINRSTIPWIIAPVDQRWYRNYFISKKICETLESLNMKKPLLKDGKG